MIHRLPSQVKDQLRPIIYRSPSLRRFVKRVNIALWRRRLARQFSSRPAANGRSATLDLPLSDISYAMDQTVVQKFAQDPEWAKNLGQVLSGSWDRSTPLDSLSIFESVRQRVAGASWQDTRFHAEWLADVRRGIPRRTSKTIGDVTAEFDRFDRLLDSVARKGYLSQLDLATKRPWDEVLIAIDRHGRFLFVNGQHRLSVAKALGLTRIPVLVWARHKHWQDFREEIVTYLHDNGGRSYQPLLHPDLAHIPASHDDNRFDIISAALADRSGSLLDIGANWGYFSLQFGRVGFRPLAVESNDKNVYFMRRLRKACLGSFEIFHGSIFDYPLRDYLTLTLALNVFHHFLKKRDTYDRLLGFLSQLRTRFLVLQPPLPGEPTMLGAYANPTPGEFVALVINHTPNLSSFTKLGHSTDGRPLFLLKAAD